MPDITSRKKVLRFGEFIADLPAGRLFKKGFRVRLRDQSFRVLGALLENPGRVVTRKELQELLWPGDSLVDVENNLNTAMARLRGALRETAEKPRYIETLPRRGYRFIASVAEAVPTMEKVRRKKLVVLPFLNLSGDPRWEYLSDALTEQIIAELGALAPDRLGVIARTSSMHYKGSDRKLGKIGHELGVEYAVEGSLLCDGGWIGINVQLIQVSDQMHLWASKYEAERRSLGLVVSQLTTEIAAQIGLPGRPASPFDSARRISVEDPVAYDLYLQGQYSLHQHTLEGMLRAKQYFQEVITRVPDFGPAHGSLAELIWYLGFMGFVPQREVLELGMSSAQRAVEIDGTLAEVHALLGSFYRIAGYSWADVEREMKLALELNPWSPVVRFRYGVGGLMPHGNMDEAVAELQQAIELDPKSAYYKGWLGELLDLGRRYEEGMEVAREVIQEQPTYWLGHFVAGQLCRDMQLLDQARSATRRAAELVGEAPMLLGWLGQMLALGGKVVEAKTLLNRLQGMSGAAYVPPTSFAWIELGLGHRDEGFNWLEKAVEVGDPMITPIKTYPFLDPLRSDPRFSRLVKKMNLLP